MSALGRLEPEGGIIRVAAPSTPDAISGALLRELHVDTGMDVAAGTLLAVTDTVDVQAAAVAMAEAELELARQSAEAAASRANEACVLADVAAREAERRINLLARELASREETEQAQGEAEAQAASCTAARASAAVARSNVNVAQAQLVHQQAALSRSYIRAPFAGRVLKITVHPGEFVGPEGILELARIDRMYAIAEVWETDIRAVRIGQTATIRSDALPAPLTGTVELIRPMVQKQDEIGTDPAARKDARIIEVEILLDDPEPAAALTHLQVEVVIDT
ncbi:MAG: HlyD family efflux transporter periplasmic adaptor subunit [Xanthomonadales bacterium]|nr:HlyD family efflux transporter periplasmic adaptor subunit [Xanthomonadales bacterium]NIN75193.1 HlyD family efflux transporter periplasmic adaptor subunit [Xanthomonadales bacterium]NIP12211.1 HlyD family efflux transporter periplasmic adaptor subunit [Xanthomonadales bacterium]NIP76457.1 HlyD family efflux transporter periplasmic adaptor subunit [Xanthomonadales bacterium]NIQ35859.1 HlyD family efflux transporter periplasmic adaptor subunit [Xanthomonadales bacterium]